MDIRWSDTDHNRCRASELIDGAEASDVYVLPEMFSTGFATKPEGIAEPLDADGSCDTLRWMQEKASEKDAAIAGSVAVRTPQGEYCNRFFFVLPDARYYVYDKRHLFTYGGEDKCYSRGKERVTVEWRGVRFALQVCYDLRFPKFIRNGVTEDGNALYDCLLYVANWPDTRRRVWDILLQARALENQCFVAGVNRVGDDLTCHYDGGTVLIDAYGKTVAAADNESECAVTAVLDMERLRNFRVKFPVLKDSD